MQSTRITVGKIIKPHGILGECVVLSLSDTGKHWVKGKEFFLGWDEKAHDPFFTVVKIEMVRWSNRKLLVKFENINNRTDAEKLIGSFLEVETRTPIKQKWLFYIDDLMDCQVYTESKKYVGKVVEVLELPANHCLEVENESGERAMIPFLKRFIKSVDINEKYIIIKPIDGLISWME